MLAAVCVILASCSSATADDVTAPRAETSTTTSEVVADNVASADNEPEAPATTEEPQASAESTSASNPPATSPPLEAYDENQRSADDSAPDPTSAWISRRAMGSESIELVWSAPVGASRYQVHRLPRSSPIAPNSSAMSVDNVLFEGDATGTFVDAQVNEGDLYWYGIRGIDENDEVLSSGWHQAAAFTDEQPPDPVDLTVDSSDDSVLLSWNEPAENFGMHGYRILRAVGSGEAEIVATTWDLNQRSFVDGDPPQGNVTYSVIAFDFHWNDSAPTEVNVDRP